jgi:hypothetical protein
VNASQQFVRRHAKMPIVIQKGQAWGLKTIESFHTHGTPPVA